MEIKNLKKAAERILKAIKKKEKIIIYGDADLDGATSVIILKESIKNLGGEVSAVYFPDREKEGYGINKIALGFLKNVAPALLIALDCGIGNFEGVKIAKSLGFEVMIIDHHQILDKLPEASIIVDPEQKGDKYPFKGLSTVGIIFKLSELLLKERMSEVVRKNFLELAALGTIADMMPEEDENKIFIMEGLKSLENSWRPGIKVFLDSALFTSQEKNYLNFRQKISKIISILNVRDVENKMPASFRVLVSSSLDDAREIVEKLLEKNEIKKEKIKEIIQELEEFIAGTEDEIIFKGESDWDLILLGHVASIICNKYKKPTFLFREGNRNSQGTVRMPEGLDGVKAMMSCSQLLEIYGGHPVAAGFSLENKNLEKFKECLIKYFKEAKRALLSSSPSLPSEA